MTTTYKVPRYLYLSSTVNDYFKSPSGKIKYILDQNELEVFSKSFVGKMNDVVAKWKKDFLYLCEFKIIPGDQYRQSEVKMIVMLPDFGSSEWLLEVAKDAWRQNPVHGEALFMAIFEQLAPDVSFLDEGWTGAIRGWLAAK